jgi:hypothetical protein
VFCCVIMPPRCLAASCLSITWPVSGHRCHYPAGNRHARASVRACRASSTNSHRRPPWQTPRRSSTSTSRCGTRPMRSSAASSSHSRSPARAEHLHNASTARDPPSPVELCMWDMHDASGLGLALAIVELCRSRRRKGQRRAQSNKCSRTGEGYGATECARSAAGARASRDSPAVAGKLTPPVTRTPISSPVTGPGSAETA